MSSYSQGPLGSANPNFVGVMSCIEQIDQNPQNNVQESNEKVKHSQINGEKDNDWVDESSNDEFEMSSNDSQDSLETLLNYFNTDEEDNILETVDSNNEDKLKL